MKFITVGTWNDKLWHDVDLLYLEAFGEKGAKPEDRRHRTAEDHPTASAVRQIHPWLDRLDQESPEEYPSEALFYRAQ